MLTDLSQIDSSVVSDGAGILVSNGLPGVIILVLILFIVYMGRFLFSKADEFIQTHKEDRELWSEANNNNLEALNQFRVEFLEKLDEWNKRLLESMNK